MPFCRFGMGYSYKYSLKCFNNYDLNITIFNKGKSPPFIEVIVKYSEGGKRLNIEEIKEKVLNDLKAGKIASYKKYGVISRDDFLSILKQLERENKI